MVCLVLCIGNKSTNIKMYDVEKSWVNANDHYQSDLGLY